MSKRSIRLPYPSDLSDKEWEIIEPFFNLRTNRGRKRVHSYREILNAIFYLLRSGCPGECYPMNIHIGKLSTTTSVFGVFMEFGNILIQF